MEETLDCVLIGTNEPPVDVYANMLGIYGKRSEAYRDLQLSFIEIDGHRLDYMGLLNHVIDPESYGTNKTDKYRAGDFPALAAVYLMHFLRKRGATAEYINLFQDEKEKLKAILASNPKCVAITTTFYVLNFEANEIIRFIREHNKETKIIIGGPLIANYAHAYEGDMLIQNLEKLDADIYVSESQGESTLFSILEALKGKISLQEVPNIFFRKDGVLQATHKATENNCLNENFIDWTRLKDYDFGPTLQTRTARSCAFKCSFCSYPARAGALTLASIETIEKELESMLSLGGIKNVVFIDDTFNVPLPRFKNFCRMIIERGFQFDWWSYFRCGNADEEAIELMAKAGCKGVFLGIESGSPTILGYMNKSATIKQYTRGIEWLKKHGIITFGSFIVGFPGETDETINETKRFIEETKPDYFRLAMWYCKNTAPILSEKEKFGITGDGFKWKHNSMTSTEAIDHIERLFLEVTDSADSVWMPQRSFDFWHIPYLLGKGFTRAQFHHFMVEASKLLRMEIEETPAAEKALRQKEIIQNLRSYMYAELPEHLLNEKQLVQCRMQETHISMLS
jgi:p-methyltransferase